MSLVSQPLSLQQFCLFRDLVEGYCGIRLDEGRKAALERALLSRMEELRVSDYPYYHLILSGSAKAEDELEKLAELLSINETHFFRDAAHFRVLREHILPAVLAKNEATKQIRVWSAGCSTGEEAYSVAMCLLDAARHTADWKLEVLGSDMSWKALGAAKRGVYKKSRVQSLDRSVLERHFVAAGEDFSVRDEVRELVRFERRNLARDLFLVETLGRFDLIFCENVTIYFSPETTKRVAEGCAIVLADGGYLFLGSSETLWRLCDGFVPTAFGDSYVYRKR